MPALPDVLYGTAWKEERTRPLTELAIRIGFRGIDTANQRRHYVETEVGAALASCIAAGVVARSDLFLQTKFTYLAGQDSQLPYDASVGLGTQVTQSLASSLSHLRTNYVDSFLLHAPAFQQGWTNDDLTVWEAMHRERLSGRARLIGVCNVSVTHLRQLVATGAAPPALVQNRCLARLGWDREVREFCKRQGIAYQGFSIVTPQPEVLRNPAVLKIAARLGASAPQVLLAFARAGGITAITGTTNAEHMKENLDAAALSLSRSDVRALKSLTC